MIEQLGGRKFIYAVIVTLLGFFLTLAGKVTADSFLNFVEIVGATYIVGNVSTKLVGIIK